MADITGTPNGETLNGTNDADLIVGGGGNDVLNGLGGDDRLEGASGSDTLDGGDGDDVILPGSAGDDVVHGGAGNDLISDDGTPEPGPERSVQWFGDDGDDRILLNDSHGGVFTLDGGAGNDRISGPSVGVVTINAGSGDDVVSGNTGTASYSVTLGDGHDVLHLGSGFMVVEDFSTSGASADRLELSNTFFFNYVHHWDGRTNLFDAGYLRLVQLGADVVLQVDYDGGGDGFTSLVQFVGVSVADFDAHALGGFAPGGLSEGLTWTGTAAADQVFGSASDDTLQGDDGDDNLNGQYGDDKLYGDGGNDGLYDIMGGNDQLFGGAGNDMLRVDRSSGAAIGDVLLDGGDGSDQLQFVNLTTEATEGSVVLRGGAGQDTLYVNAPIGVTLEGGDGGDTLYGGSGGDILDGGAGADTMSGGAGDDTYYVDTLLDSINEAAGEGADVVVAGISWILNANVEVLQLTGTGALSGVGNALNNQLLGNSGNNTLDGGAGDDLLMGDAGDDLLIGGPGNDFIHGGAGTDTVSYAAESSFIVVTLDGGSGSGWTQWDTLVSVENVVGTAFDDTLVGSTVGNVIEGGAGKDALYGRAGDDSLSGGAGDDVMDGGEGDDLLSGGLGFDTANYASATAGVSVNLSVTGAQNTGGAGVDTLTGVENLTGSSFDDVLTGDAGANVISGGGGTDTLNGGDGNDVITGRGLISGGAGADTISSTGGTIDAGAGDDLIKFLGLTIGDTTEPRTGSLDGGAGVDTLLADRVDLSGMSITGVEVLSARMVTATAAQFAGFSQITAAQFPGQPLIPVLTLASAGIVDFSRNVVGPVEAKGSSGDDVITGTNSNDVLRSSAGRDVLNGAGGDDIFQVDGVLTGEMNGGDGVDTIRTFDRADISGVTLTGIEQLFGEFTATAAQFNAVTRVASLWGDDRPVTGLVLASAGTVDFSTKVAAGASVSVTGSAGADTLIGTISGDTIQGAGGADALFGGDGDDLLAGGAGGDLLNGGAGVDTATYADATAGVSVSLTKTGAQVTVGSGSDILVSIENVTGSAFADSLRGNSGANVLIGGAGDDVIEGGGGADRLEGGEGVDTATYINTAGGVGVTVDLRQSGQQNTGGAGLDVLIGFENLSGSRYDDRLIGDGGANVLEGRGGADVLEGGAGNDVLDGGTGADTADYAAAVVGVVVNLNDLGLAQNTGGAGVDTLLSIENVVGSAFNDNLRGNAASNVLEGGAGNDVLDGGGGHDKLYGGAGTDTASYANSAAAVTVRLTTTSAQVTGGAGSDTLVGIENLTGSRYDDRLTGDGGNNVLSGGSGDDLLDGGAGADTLDGGLNVDTATYAGATAGVTVNLTLSGAQNTGGAGIDTLISIENLTGSAFNDSLRGNTGANTLAGGAGDDVLEGGGGEDRLDGGTGNDTASYAHSAAAVTINLNAGGTQATGGAGTDTLISIENVTGSAFADTIRGNAVANVLDGGAGADVLLGGGGNDVLIGGAGDDVMSGGTGDDLFVFGPGFGQDRIDDFVAGGVEDRLDFSAYTGTGVTWTLTQVGEDAVFSFSDGSTLTLAHVQATSLAQTGAWGWG